MSNTHIRAASVLSLLLGIVLVVGNSVTILQAKLTGQGSTVLDRPDQPQMLLPGHSAALPPVSLLAQAHTQLLIGMLLILAGFLFYAIVRVRENGQRTVHISSVPRIPARATRLKRRGPTYYWMEIRI